MQLMLRGMNLGLFVLGNWFQISNAQIRYLQVIEQYFFKSGRDCPIDRNGQERVEKIMNKKSKMKIAPFTLSFAGNTFKKASRINKKTLGDQDAHSKVVDVVDDVEVGVEDSFKENFVADDSWTIV